MGKKHDKMDNLHIKDTLNNKYKSLKKHAGKYFSFYLWWNIFFRLNFDMQLLKLLDFEWRKEWSFTVRWFSFEKWIQGDVHNLSEKGEMEEGTRDSFFLDLGNSIEVFCWFLHSNKIKATVDRIFITTPFRKFFDIHFQPNSYSSSKWRFSFISCSCVLQFDNFF